MGVAGACEKKEISMFTTDDAGIYFQRVTSYIYGSTTENYGDSVAYSFVSAQATAKSVVLSATVRTMERWQIMTDLSRWWWTKRGQPQSRENITR